MNTETVNTGVWGATRLLFSRAEVAVLLCISERSLDRLIVNNQISSLKKGRRRLFTRDALMNFAGSAIAKQL